MAKRSQRKGRAAKKVARPRNGFCNVKTDKKTVLKHCKWKSCKTKRWVEPADAHHVRFCFEHRDLAEKERRKLAMRVRRAKARKASRKSTRTTRKAA